ncbi:hypothetical protein B0H66DRAFT_477849, partial [Apodospora peruviana]
SIQYHPVKVLIRKLQKPSTLACGMVVDILPTTTSSSLYHQPEKTPSFFLKPHDWQYAYQLRADHRVEPFSPQLATDYTAFIQSGETDAFLEHLLRSSSENDEENWDNGQTETALAHEMNIMYRSETAVYAQLSDLQGTTIPRLITAVTMNISPDGTNPEQREHFKTKGILLEHINGVILSDLLSLPPPDGIATSNWQDIVDQAVAIAPSLGDRDLLNQDVRPENFTVQRLPGHNFRVNMTDFGQSRLRRPAETDLEWGRAKHDQDEEGAIGLVMQRRLKKKLGVEIQFVASGRYLEFAELEE